VGQEKWLRECIESILAQDRGQGWAEIVVVDDGSQSPMGRNIAQSYAPRVKYRYNSTNLGLIPNHNHCLDIARGEYIHFVHQDDRIEPGFYDAVLDPMVARDDIVASFSSWKHIDHNGDFSGQWPIENTKAGIHKNLLHRLGFTTCMMFPSIIVRRSAYEKVGGFSPSFGFIFDVDMWSRLAAFGPVWNEPKPLASYRRHDGSATHTFSKLEQSVDRMRLRERILANLPHSARYDTARIAFDNLFQISWRSLLEAKNMNDTDLERACAFLTQNWATQDQRQKITAFIKQARLRRQKT
jgi:glycosyltransferase involved in cell wall biosynthesis